MGQNSPAAVEAPHLLLLLLLRRNQTLVQESRWDGWRRAASSEKLFSFLALIFVGGLAPGFCGQRMPCSQHGAAGQTPQPVQEQLEPPGHSLAPPRSQKFPLVNQEEQEAELC